MEARLRTDHTKATRGSFVLKPSNELTLGGGAPRKGSIPTSSREQTTLTTSILSVYRVQPCTTCIAARGHLFTMWDQKQVPSIRLRDNVLGSGKRKGIYDPSVNVWPQSTLSTQPQSFRETVEKGGKPYVRQIPKASFWRPSSFWVARDATMMSGRGKH